MLRRGDSHASIARFFGVNMGRIADVKSQRRHAYVPETPQEFLPMRLPTQTPYEEWVEANKEINVLIAKIIKDLGLRPRRKKQLSTASKQLTLKI